jgi:hypothetical protein
MQAIFVSRRIRPQRSKEGPVTMPVVLATLAEAEY